MFESIPILHISIFLGTILSIGGYVCYLAREFNRQQQEEKKKKTEKLQVSQKEEVLVRTQTAAVATAA